MRISVIIACSAVVIAALAYFRDSGEAPPVSPPPPAAAVAGPAPAGVADDTDEISQLELQLLQERRARRALEARLEQMGSRLERIENLVAESPGTALVPAPEPLDATGAEPSARTWFDETVLIDSGMDAALAGELKVYFERLELERLHLRDRAAREGWERGRLREEMQTLGEREQALKDKLGEDGYDAYLYASGQSNRVAVTSVLASAQAAQAGIRAGDHIIRYDNERVYNWRDLRDATRAGEITDTVEVEVERDGERLQFYLARGPLGIRMDSRSIAP